MAMSVKIISQVWEQSAQDGSALLMLLAIADYAHDDGLVWVNGITVQTLADKTRVQKRQAQNLIQQLDTTGEIYAPVVQGRGHATRYFVTVGFTEQHITEKLIQQYAMGPIDAATTAAEIVRRRDAYAALRASKEKVQENAPFTQKVQRSTPIKPKKVQSATKKGAIQRKRNERSSASQSVAPDPIRIDPYISPNGESAARKTRTRIPSEKKPKDDKPTTPIAIIQALADVCLIDRQLAPEKTHILLATSAKKIYCAGQSKGQTDEQIIEAIRYVGAWYAKYDWRGKNGDTPTPSHILEVWRQAYEAKAAPQPQSQNGHKPDPYARPALPIAKVERPADALSPQDAARLMAKLRSKQQRNDHDAS